MTKDLHRSRSVHQYRDVIIPSIVYLFMSVLWIIFSDKLVALLVDNPLRVTGFQTFKGIGLSICRGIISEYGGKISAESTLGKGATFTIDLPAHA